MTTDKLMATRGPDDGLIRELRLVASCRGEEELLMHLCNAIRDGRDIAVGLPNGGIWITHSTPGPAPERSDHD